LIYPVDFEYEKYVHKLKYVLDNLLCGKNLYSISQIYFKITEVLNRVTVTAKQAHNIVNFTAIKIVIINKIIQHANEQCNGIMQEIDNAKYNTDPDFAIVSLLQETALISPDQTVFNCMNDLLDVLLQDSPQGSYVLK
jgi:hypothetical protein